MNPCFFKFKSISCISILVFAVLLTACTNEKIKPVPSKPTGTTGTTGCGPLTNVSFSTQVQPIINANCVMCHDESAGIKLTTYTEILGFANSGQLLGVLDGNPSYLQMPPSGYGAPVVDSCEFKTIYNWVQQGKKDN